MQTLIKFKEFFDKITAETGRNYKISVLEEYKNDEYIRYLLDFIYNPYITTGISDKKLAKNAEENLEKFKANFHQAIPLTADAEQAALVPTLEFIKANNTGTDENIKFVQLQRYIFFSEFEDLFNKIVTKNIQLGVDAKTINKVIPGLIPEFNVQLSNKYFDKPEVVEGKEFVLTTKIDGSRIIAMKDNGKVSFWTRQGQKYEGLVDLEKELLNIPLDNFVLDGELVAIDTDKENTYKNTMKLSRTKDLEKHGLKMLVFDCMSVEDFKNQKNTTPYIDRRVHLCNLFEPIETKIRLGGKWQSIPFLCGGTYYGPEHCFKFFEKLPILYHGTDTSKIIEILNEQTAKGEEGIMINIADAPYEFKRTNNLLKVKKFQDTELKIIGFEEGTNKLAGTLGAFICEYKGNTVKVGSGLSDEDRAYFWNNKIKFLGRYITVKYFETSTDSKTGLESLRFPIYMRVREDMPTIPLDVNGPRFEW